MTVFDLKPNQSATVLKIDIKDTRIKRRIYDLGIYEGEKITFLKASILEKVVLISVKNYALCLKNSIAQNIEVSLG